MKEDNVSLVLDSLREKRSSLKTESSKQGSVIEKLNRYNEIARESDLRNKQKAKKIKRDQQDL